LTPAERNAVLNQIECGGLFKFDRAPVVGNFVMPDIGVPPSLDEILALSESFSELNVTQQREGVVFKSLNSRYSFKAISNKYLLNQKD
jgi:hypothetical protein